MLQLKLAQTWLIEIEQTSCVWKEPDNQIYILYIENISNVLFKYNFNNPVQL